MTTIAWDGCNLAADRCISTNRQKSFVKTKLVKVELEDGLYLIAGFCGNAELMPKLFAWAESAFDPDEAPDLKDENYEGLVAYSDKTLYSLLGGVQIELDFDKPIAIGSGGTAAHGALLAGMTAVRAVEIAKKIDPFTDGVVESYSVYG